MSKAQTIDQAEVDKFSAIADEWWDEKGKFKPLHQMNPIRLGYIRDKSVEHFNLDDKSMAPFMKLEVLDIGCGGGLLSVPMARMGANVTGVDASEKNISVAKNYAERNKIKVNYQHSTVEELAKGKQKFDIILNMEVVEHVADQKLFLESCAKLLKPNGLMFLASINRTPKSYLFAIVGAEYVLRLLPKGTHDWKKFPKPSELNAILEPHLKLKDMAGMHYNPLSQAFSLVKDVSVNYIMLYAK